MTLTPVLAWSIGPIEIVIILLVVLLIFGKRLPEMGKSVGRSIVEFKKGLRGEEKGVDVDDEIDERDPPKLERDARRTANPHDPAIGRGAGEKRADKTRS